MALLRSIALSTLGVSLTLVSCGHAGESLDVESREWVVDSAPALQVGGHDTRPEYTLYDVRGVSRLPDGRIVLANAGTSQLRFFGPDGNYLKDVGGEGDGPGELRYIIQMTRGDGDSLIVMSRDPGLTWFDRDGRYAHSVRMTHHSLSEAHPCRHGEGDSWKIRPDGTLLRLLTDSGGRAGCPETPDGPWRRTGLLGVPAEDGPGFDTIALMPADDRVSVNYRVFGHDLLLGVETDRIYAADTDSESILALSYSGDTLAVLPGPFEQATVPEDLKVEGLIEVTQSDGSVRFIPGYTEYPERFPRYGHILVDSEGYLWVMKYPLADQPFHTWRLSRAFGALVPSGGAEWRILDREGLVVAEVRTPPGLFVSEVGVDYVLGVSRDEFNVETVELYGLTRD